MSLRVHVAVAASGPATPASEFCRALPPRFDQSASDTAGMQSVAAAARIRRDVVIGSRDGAGIREF
jgi:hypothetical protein